jgi:hypothetical protein
VHLVAHDLARCLGTSGKHELEKPLGCCLIATLLQQEIELDAVLIDCSPQQIRLAAAVSRTLRRGARWSPAYDAQP